MAVFWQNYKNPKDIAFANTRQFVTLVDTLGAGVDWNTATAEVYIWQGGRVADKPSTPQVSIVLPQEKADVFGSGIPLNGVVQFEIADFVRSYLNFENYNLDGTSILDIGGAACWVQYDVTDDGTSTAYNSDIFLFVDGYGLYSENTNAGLTGAQATLNPLWTQAQSLTYSTSQNGDIWMPVYIGFEHTGAVDSIYFESDDSAIDDDVLLADPTGFNFTVGSFNVDSATQIKLIPLLKELSDLGYTIPTSADNFTVSMYNTGTGSIPSGSNTFKHNFKCTRAEGTVIYYQNRYGAVNTFPITGRIETQVQAEREKFMNNTFNTDTLAYDVNDHLDKIFQTTAKKRFTINTGLITEVENNMLIEMLIAKRHWMIEDGVQIPIVPTAKSRQLIGADFSRPTNVSLQFEGANPYAGTML